MQEKITSFFTEKKDIVNESGKMARMVLAAGNI